MKALLAFISCAMFSYAQPVTSRLRVDDIGHSSFRVTWDSDVAPDNQRVDWGPTPSLGRTLYTYNPYYSASTQQLIVSGLQIGVDTDLSRKVYFCARSHNSNGWSPCTPQQLTLLPLPAIHPALPALPLPAPNFPISEPSTASCTSLSVAPDLSDLQSTIETAASNQGSGCQVITIPADAAGSPYVRIPAAADADTVSAVDTGTNTIAISSNRNTYTDGDRVRVSSDAYNRILIPSGLSESADYCVHAAAGEKFQLATWPDCSSVVTLGSAGLGAWYVMPYPPRNSNFIILQGNIPLPPENVRVSDAWRTHAPAWGVSCTGLNNNYCSSLVFGAFAHHWYIKGIDFRSGSGDATTTDPAPWANHITMRPSNSYVAFDRIWVTGAGKPAREYVPIYWEGSAVQIRASAITKVEYWRPSRSGLAQTIAAARLSIAAGAYNTGLGDCPSIPPSTATLTASAGGTAYITVKPSDCSVIVTVPDKTKVTCSNCTAETGTDWPKNAEGSYTNISIGSCVFASGSWTSCTNFDDINNGLSGYYFDSPQNIVSCGPGPMLIENTYHEGSGILWHFDDTGSNVTYGFCHVNPDQPPADITFLRNRLETPARLIHGSPSSDGFNYRNRHNFECKRCARVLIKGNEFSGSFRDVANDGASLMINGNASFSSAPTASYAGDITIDSNWIHDANGGIMTSGGPPGSGAFIPRLGRRFRIVNNLVSHINGYRWRSDLPIGAAGNGFCFQIGHGGEDVVYDHNTCYSVAGQLPSALQIVSKMVEGFQFTNNAAYIHADGGRQGLVIDWGASLPSCGGKVGTDGVKCFTNGVSTFLNNLLISGYINSRTMTGDSDASAFAATWAGSGSFLPTESTVPARLAGVKWGLSDIIDLGFADDHSGQPDAGVNENALEDALGWVRNVRTFSIDRTSFSVGFHAPDPSAACYVGYGTSPDPTTWSRTIADTSAAQERSIDVTGLESTTYFFQAWCTGTAPTTTQTVTTLPATDPPTTGPPNPALKPNSRLTAESTAADGYGWYGVWSTRRKIIIDHSKVSGSSVLANFPVLVAFSDPELKSLSYGGKVGKSDGSDILFTAADGISKLSHEMESYDPATGNLVAWVRVPALTAAADTPLFFYYGKSDSSESGNSADVWDANYRSVNHFKDLGMADSTQYGNSTTAIGGRTEIVARGMVGPALSVGGAGGQFSIPYNASWNGPFLGYTVELWFKPGLAHAESGVLAIGDRASPFNIWLNEDGSTTFRMDTSNGYCAAGGVLPRDNAFHHLALTYDASKSQLNVYIDGVGVAPTSCSGTLAIPRDALSIGSSGDGQASFDELRISASTRSEAWIVTGFNNQSLPAAFYRIEPSETRLRML